MAELTGENRTPSLFIRKQHEEIDCSVCSSTALYEMIVDAEDKMNLCKECSRTYIFEKIKAMIRTGPVCIVGKPKG